MESPIPLSDTTVAILKKIFEKTKDPKEKQE